MATLSEDVRIGELEEALRRLQRKLAKREDEREAWKAAIEQGVKEAILAVGAAAPIPRSGRDRRKGPEVALLHLTDWQLGKLTPDYDSDVAEKRVKELVTKVCHIAEIQRPDHPVREVAVLLGGDMVEGVSIFPGQAFEIDSSTFSQMSRTARLIASLLLLLLENFELVSVWDQYGNHGRIGRKGDSPREDNWDNIVYFTARLMVGEQPRLNWKDREHAAWYSIVELGAYRAMLVHGDQVRAFGGNFPAQGVMKKCNAWAAGAIPEKFQDVYIGHRHQPMELQLAGGGMVYMTPSTESGSPYAPEFMGAHGLPGQRLHFIDPSKGRVTSRYNLEPDA